jgi:hypothetical protein
MIAFGCSISEPEPYLRYAKPGIELAAEADSQVFAFAAVDSICRSYNLLLDAAANCDDLEMLVLVHPHAQISDPELCDKLRQAFADPQVAVVGCAGAADAPTIAWWEGNVSCGQVVHRYTDYGGGDLPAFSWKETQRPPSDVDVLDGFLLALSPWAVRNVRFDETIALGHGYDFDYCRQVRAAGRKVQTAELRMIEHRSVDLIGDLELWTESHIVVARKWADRRPATHAVERHADGENERYWRARARRAEAEREAARAMTYFKRLGYDARLEPLEKDLAAATSTLSWRLTSPLRRLNHWRRHR